MVYKNHDDYADEYELTASDLAIYYVANQGRPENSMTTLIDYVGQEMAKGDFQGKRLEYAFLFMTEILDDVEEGNVEGDIEMLRARVAHTAQGLNVVESEELAFAFERHGIRAY